VGRTISIYSSTAIEPDEFLCFVASAGGEITDEKTIRGHISSGRCRVWFYRVREQLAGNFEAPEESVELKLGAPVRACVDLQLSHHEGSGDLALKFAYRFAQKWHSVASCAAYEALTSADIELRLAEPHWPFILSSAVKLLFTATPKPKIESVIEWLGGIKIDASDLDLVASAQKNMKVFDGTHYDPRHDEIIGYVPAGNADVWVLCSALAEEGEGAATEPDERLITVAAHHLGTCPSWMIRLLIGYGASPEIERVALAFSHRAIQLQSGIAVGIFAFVLDAEGLSRMVESERGFLIA
jgi:hypothetical protein